MNDDESLSFITSTSSPPESAPPTCKLKGCESPVGYRTRGMCALHARQYPAYPKNTTCALVGCTRKFYAGYRPYMFCKDHRYMEAKAKAKGEKKTSCPEGQAELSCPEGQAERTQLIRAVDRGPLPRPSGKLLQLVEQTKIINRRKERLALKGLVYDHLGIV